MANSKNKKDLAAIMAVNFGLTKKEALAQVDCLFDTISEILTSGQNVEISGFGKFLILDRNARSGINPATKQLIDIPAFKAVRFKPSKLLKDSVKHAGESEIETE